MDPIAGGNASQCDKHALTDFWGWMVQCLLAGLAFTCLIVKRFFEPKYVRRSWETWWYDTSKQGIGALVIHMINVYLAPMFQGDPCTWYIINFLLDSTIGLFIIYIGIRVSQLLAIRKQCPAIMFGEYTAPRSWLYQTCIYIGLMIIVKLITTLVIQLDFWNNVKDIVLSPFASPMLELVMVMLVIPFFINILMFWVTDNFLMRHKRKARPIATISDGAEATLFERVKVRYRSLQGGGGRTQPLLLSDESCESDAMMAASEESDNGGMERVPLAASSSSSSSVGASGNSPALTVLVSETRTAKQRNSISSLN